MSDRKSPGRRKHRRKLARNSGLVDWLLACPSKGYFVPIESAFTGRTDTEMSEMFSPSANPSR